MAAVSVTNSAQPRVRCRCISLLKGAAINSGLAFLKTFRAGLKAGLNTPGKNELLQALINVRPPRLDVQFRAVLNSDLDLPRSLRLVFWVIPDGVMLT
jgi:hypothetical protein